MSKAGEKALQYCCTKCANSKLNCGMKLLSHGGNCIACGNYIEGYHQAEKDLELTWEDIRELYIIFAEVDAEIELCKIDIKSETIDYYQEVLKRFKAQKGEDCEKLYEEPQVYETEDGEIITYSETDGYKVVEPKFKVGDWITNEEYVWQIDEVKRKNYLLIDSEGNLFAEEIANIDSEFHLWATTDAKDGDVLVDEDNNIGLYRGEKDDFWESYIYLGCNNYLYGPNIGGYHEHKNTKPATKEQRDLLFKKMKEEGYKWDAEKKEVKKIEQKPTIEMITPEESLGIDSETYNKIVNACLYGESKSAWNEEDEEMLENIMDDYDDVTEHNLSDDIGKVTWLKSLKQRLKG